MSPPLVAAASTAEPMPAGAHFLHWDGRDERGVAVGSGAYFVRAGEAVQKLIVER